jgi:exoribonuclease R
VAKAEAATELETQVEELKTSLASALAEVETKGSTTTELMEAKAASESQLKEATEALEKLRLEHQDGSSALQSIQEDVCPEKGEPLQRLPACCSLQPPNQRPLLRKN